MLVIDCEINFIQTWSANCVITNSAEAGTFAITDTKFYVPVVTIKLLQKLKSGFKCTIDWNKYQSKISALLQNQYLDYLTDSSFQGVNRLFVLSFENITDRTAHTGYYFPKVEIKEYNAMIDGRSFFYHSVKNDIRTFESIRKIATGQGDEYTTDCLLDYPHFKENYELIAVDLNKEQALDVDSVAIQQINFNEKSRASTTI